MSHGNVLRDGYQVLINFSLNAAVKFQEKEIQPPGLDSGGKISQTNQRNARYRTYSPKSLIDVDDIVLKVAWDPQVYSDIVTMMGKVQEIFIELPDTTVLTQYGWIDKFKPDSMKEGTEPEAAVHICVGNLTPGGVETGPSAGATTTTATTTTTTPNPI
jgi:hypothetical protein